VLVAMRQMGEAWGNFDREVMRPLFGGPGSSRPGSSDNLAQQPAGVPRSPAGGSNGGVDGSISSLLP
jgi:hypothetical protein